MGPGFYGSRSFRVRVQGSCPGFRSSPIFKLHFLFTYFLFIILIFIITTIRLFKFGKLTAVNATTIEQRITLICCAIILMFVGKIYIRFCSDLVSTSETKPWPLLLLLMSLLDVPLVIVELVLDWLGYRT